MNRSNSSSFPFESHPRFPLLEEEEVDEEEEEVVVQLSQVYDSVSVSLSGATPVPSIHYYGKVTLPL